MIPFDYRQARDTDDAVAIVAESPQAAFLGGGTNLVDHMKLGVTNPELLVDVTGLVSDAIEPLDDGGVRIGAAVRNSDLAADPVVRQRYPALSRAVLSGASGQLRNLATTGGNVLQRTRCVYFQDVTTPCNKREPGSGCSAFGGYTRHHAVLGASSHCIATHPSDMAVALAALDAVVHTRSPGGERSVPLVELHRLPGEHPERDTVLEHGELITAVDVPAPPAGARSTYRKTRDRASFAFALASVAAEITLTNGTVDRARLAFGGLAHKPWRATRAEQALQGSVPTAENVRAAAEAELIDAEPVRGSAYKVPLARNVLGAVLRELTSEGAPHE